MRNLLIVLSGPSGVGKGTIVNKLMERGEYALSVSCTTRDKRVGEIEGKSYFFISAEQFREKIAEGGFLEYSEHFGKFYGTPRAFVEEKLLKSDVILEIEVDGALQVKRAHPEALLIMILPPSEGELKKRLTGRGTEDEKKIAERIARLGYELSKKDEYDYAVVNDELDEAVRQVELIIEKEKAK